MLSIANLSCSGVSEGTASSQTQAVDGKEQQRVAGEYIVTLRPRADEASVRALFSAFDLQEFSNIGGQRWLLKIRKDPGPAVIQSKAPESQVIEAIQPNFIYRQQSKPGFGAR